jgi:hypothetical protein
VTRTTLVRILYFIIPLPDTQEGGHNTGKDIGEVIVKMPLHRFRKRLKRPEWFPSRTGTRFGREADIAFSVGTEASVWVLVSPVALGNPVVWWWWGGVLYWGEVCEPGRWWL